MSGLGKQLWCGDVVGWRRAIGQLFDLRVFAHDEVQQERFIQNIGEFFEVSGFVWSSISRQLTFDSDKARFVFEQEVDLAAIAGSEVVELPWESLSFEYFNELCGDGGLELLASCSAVFHGFASMLESFLPDS